MVFNLRTFSFSDSVEDNVTPPRSFSPRGEDNVTPPRSFSPRDFSPKELQAATRNFSHNNFLTRGGFGAVYRGCLADGSVVAVKRAITIDQEREEAFKREVQVASLVSTHPNVLHLRGFCRTKEELSLVYPLMIHNSLAFNLWESKTRWTPLLDWTIRKRIALGAARGIAHLHNQGDVRIMHCHICPSSILLNAQFEATIGGFCFSVILHERNLEERSIEWRIMKNDVFAFGRTLLQLISGQKIMEIGLVEDENLSLEKWVSEMMNEDKLDRVIDPNLQGHYVEEEAKQLVRLALLCVYSNPSFRPNMSRVVRMLEYHLLGQQQHPIRQNSWSQSEGSSTRYYSFPPSPSSEVAL